MKKKSFWAALVLVTLVVSCKKSDPSPTPTPTVSYFNATAGNTWNYETTQNPSSTPVVSSYTLTSTTSDSTINGKTYHIFSRSDGGREYYNTTGNDYYEYLKLAVLDTIKTENLYLKAGQGTGVSWTQTLAPITYSGLVTVNLSKADTIIEKGISKTVKGITYTDVIHVRGAIKLVSINPPLVTPTVTSTVDNYYAPKVGRIYSYIKVRMQVPATPPLITTAIDQTFETKTELVSTNF